MTSPMGIAIIWGAGRHVLICGASWQRAPVSETKERAGAGIMTAAARGFYS